MTGHLVLSTLHTNDAIGAVSRLADIGAERYLIGSTVIGVLAQRLVRRLCYHCRRTRTATAPERTLLRVADGDACEIYEANGCPLCLGTGYLGRIGLFEALWVGESLSQAIAEQAGEAALRQQARGLKTLWRDGCDKVLRGETALAEIKHLALGAGEG